MGMKIEISRKVGKFELCINHNTTKRRIGILGASGCGKSMTLQCIAGIHTPDSGVIEVDERTLFDSDNRINVKMKNRKAGYLFQDYALFPTMTVKENIMSGIRLPKKERKRKAEEYMERFSLAGLEGRLPGELSGGQRQRTAMARMLASEPEIILLDEPFSALDSHLKEQLQLDLEYMLREYEGTVVFVSHSRDEMYRFTEELIILDNGRQVEAGSTKEIFRSPKTQAGAKLTGCKNISKIDRIAKDKVYAIDWDLTLKIPDGLAESVNYIGIRAHDIENVETMSDNVMELQVQHVTILPFEVQYLLGNKDMDTMQTRANQKCLIWKVNRNLNDSYLVKGDSVKIRIPTNKLMQLQ